MLRPDGSYVANVIDYPSFRFARAELATLRRSNSTRSRSIAPQSVFDGVYGGNLVLVASDRPTRRGGAPSSVAAEHGDVVLDGARARPVRAATHR